MKKIAVAVAFLAVSLSGASGQDGATAFKKCMACHDVGPAAKNKIGPALNGLDGRKSGSVAGFVYSEANKSSNITWDEVTFLEYIKDPKAKIPKTKMVFVGIKDEAEAKSLWAYLKQYSADGNTR